jgi:hypothetical protein
MRFVVALLALVALASGCTTPTYWSKRPYPRVAEFNRDVRECEAQSAPASGEKSGAISEAFRKLRVEQAFNDCMIAKGYQETKSPPTAD